MRKDIKNREEAMKWWNSLSFEEQFFKVIDHLGTDWHPQTITGRQIESIWKKLN